MIRFVHTADIHFGMENYGKIDPASGIHTRLLDFERALNFCIDYAISERVDFFLFAGDAYKTTMPSPTQQRLLLRCFLRLQQANIPLVIVVGNHDNPLSFGKANTLDLFQDLPLEGFHVISKPTSFTLITKNGPIQIVGMPWPTRSIISMTGNHALKSNSDITQYISQATAAIIQKFAETLNPEIPALLTGHITVSSGIFSGSEKRAVYGTDPLLLPSQLAIPPFDYVGLGHLHRHQNLNSQGYPAVVYSGSPERIDFGERKEEKGFCSVTIHEKNSTSFQFIKTPTRPFFYFEIVLQPFIDQTEQILRKIASQDIRDGIVKIVYHVPAQERDEVDLAAVQRACSLALDLIAVIPIHQPKYRTKRTQTHIEMDLPTLLENYFETRPELREQKAFLIAKACALQEEFDTDGVHEKEQ